jgi:hypothetical protein
LAPGRSLTIAIAVLAHAPRPRTVAFEHQVHDGLACLQCHTRPVTLEAEPSVMQCSGCHAEHHKPGRACASCHTTDQTVAAHRRPVEAHQECDACHSAERIAPLVPTRSLCLTCHAGEDHYPAKQCTSCHFQASPEVFQAQLRHAGGG